MAAEEVFSEIMDGTHREKVVLMDDFGVPFELYVWSGADRTACINAECARMDNDAAAWEQYLTAHSKDVVALKAAGAAKKQALKAPAAADALPSGGTVTAATRPARA